MGNLICSNCNCLLVDNICQLPQERYLGISKKDISDVTWKFFFSKQFLDGHNLTCNLKEDMK